MLAALVPTDVIASRARYQSIYLGRRILLSARALQRRKRSRMVLRQPTNEVAVGQQSRDHSREDHAFEHRETFGAAILRQPRRAPQGNMPHTETCEDFGRPRVGEKNVQSFRDLMKTSLCPRCHGGQGDSVVLTDPSALGVAYPHNCDSILDSVARSPRMDKDG